MTHATKEIFLKALDCPGWAWLLRTAEGEEKLSEADKLRIDEGREIGKLAREAVGGGVYVMPRGTISATEQTQTLIREDGVEVIYEATFEWEGLIAKPDILKREAGGWAVLEVKSAKTDKKEYVEDLAYTVMVAQGAGLQVSRAALVLLSEDYRLGMSVSDLFVESDHTDDLEKLLPVFRDRWKGVADLVLGEGRPPAQFALACKKCEHYGENCIDQGVEHSILELPRLSASKFAKLEEQGVHCICDIPSDFELTGPQEKVRAAVVSGRPWKSPGLKGALDAVEWPAFYLDFETTKTAVPLLSDLAPQQQFPTQYSIHVFTDIDTEADHGEFLADHAADERRQLAEKLLADLEEEGSIIVYHASMEKGVLKYLAALYDDLADQLERCVARLVDLEKIIIEHFIHPDFNGSTSIKQTLPALLGHDPYNALGIKNGDDASALFARMARREKTEAECKMLREDLLKYCWQDTKAMVDVHRALLAHVS